MALDIAHETAELMKHQIQMQAAIAAHSQNLLSMQLVLKLLEP